MKFQGVKKLILGLTATATAAGVVAYGALAYQSGLDFTPTGANRALNVNQVVFPDGSKTTDRTENNSDDSELWQKDQNAQDDQRPQDSNDADYLFENGAAAAPDADKQITLNQEENTTSRGPAASAVGANGTVYDVTGDAANADLVLNGGAGATVVSGGTVNGGSADNANNSGNSRDDTAAGDSGSSGLRPTPIPDTPVTPVEPDTPSKWDHVKDNDGSTSADYNEESKFTPAKVANAQVNYVAVGPSAYSEYPLYVGQRATKTAIFNALDTRIFITDADGKKNEYSWASDQVGIYFNIDAVSFDGGKTWTTDFPVTIPKDAEMVVKTSYRLSRDGEWVPNEDVTLTPASTRVYVLSTTLDDDTTQISDDITLNLGNLAPEVGSKMNLYNFQRSLLGTDELTQLFTGWQEDGEQVSFLYPVTAGRHFLEPGAYVDLNTDLYKAQVKAYFMEQEDWPGDTALSFFQTLTDYYGFGDEVLDVPEYIQAVDIDDWAYVFVGSMHLPDTVLYANVKNAIVMENFTVDEDNPAYKAQDGLLYTIDGSELVGIPYFTEELTIPAGVKKIDVPKSNSLTKVVLEAQTGDELPEINLDALGFNGECDIYVKNTDVLQDFITQNSTALNENSEVRLFCGDNQDAPVIIKNNCMMLGDNLLGVMECGRAVLLPDEVTFIQADSLQMTDGSHNSATALVLPENGQTVTLGKNWNEGTDIRKILCYNQAQADAALASLPAGSDISVQVMQQSLEGAYYFADNETVLVRMPAEMAEFDGTLTAQDGSTVKVTTVGDMAFQGNTSLRWVVLPAPVDTIGYQAFKGCTALEGLFIQNSGSVTVGDKSFDECSTLRFAASNSLNPTFVNGYEIPISPAQGSNYNMFRFGPKDLSGYGGSWVRITVGAGNENLVGDYQLEDCGGTKVLYLADSDGNPWLALRSGAVLDEPVLNIRDETDEVFNFAFESLHTADDTAFTTNIEDFNIYLGEGAFYNSDIGPDVVLPEYAGMGNSLFGHCQKLETVKFSYGCGLTTFDYGSNNMFDGCTNLREVTFDELDSTAVIVSDLFYGCNNLQTLNFLSETSPKLALYYGLEYHFNDDSDFDESTLTVNVPEGCKDAYLENWRYAFLGYDVTDSFGSPARAKLWNAIKWDTMDPETYETATDDEVDELFKQQLGGAENRVRVLLGLDPVSEPTNTYYYREKLDPETYNSIYTLVRVSPDVTAADLSADAVGLSWFDHVNYIAAGAFADCKNLESVYIPDELDGIYSGAFGGVGYDAQDATSGITILCDAVNPPALLGVTDGEPFTFGVPDERVEFVFTNLDEQTMLDAWTLPMAGYTSTEALENAVTAELYPDGGEIDPDAVQAAVDAVLQTAQNRVRTVLFGSEPVAIEAAAAQMQEIATPESAQPAAAEPAPAPAETPAAAEEPEPTPEPTPEPDPAEAETPQPATPETAQAPAREESNE